MTLLTAIMVTVLVSLVGINSIVHFRMFGAVNFALLGYLAIASELFAALQGSSMSVFWFFACGVVCMVSVGCLSFVVDAFVLAPLKHSSAVARSVASVCVYLVIVGAISTIFAGKDLIYRVPSIAMLGSVDHNPELIRFVVTITGAVVLLGFLFVFFRTIVGKKFRAMLSNEDVAFTNGISLRSSQLFLSGVTGIFTTIVSVFAVGKISPELINGYIPLSFYSSVAFIFIAGLAVAAVARQRNLIVCIIASLCIGVATSVAAYNDDVALKLVRYTVTSFGLNKSVVLPVAGSFGVLVAPFIVLVVGLLISPLWNKEGKVG